METKSLGRASSFYVKPVELIEVQRDGYKQKVICAFKWLQMVRVSQSIRINRAPFGPQIQFNSFFGKSFESRRSGQCFHYIGFLCLWLYWPLCPVSYRKCSLVFWSDLLCADMDSPYIMVKQMLGFRTSVTREDFCHRARSSPHFWTSSQLWVSFQSLLSLFGNFSRINTN